MNTPKTFEPVVTPGMVRALMNTEGGTDKALAAALANPDFQRQLRAYAAEVARAMVPDKQVALLFSSDPAKCFYPVGFNQCRAATLSAIDEWEKNNAP